MGVSHPNRMRLTRRRYLWPTFLLSLMWLAASGYGWCQTVVAAAPIDSDRDGLSDVLEQALLQQFAPAFMVGRGDCAKSPAEFWAAEKTPRVKAQNGTIYGEVSPARESTAAKPVVEIHFYHLWSEDCGPHGHALDTEHVAALVRASGGDLRSRTWKAAYWYAAAHENTVCDVSQIARASTLDAEEHGPRIWISPGKHASYLNASLCARGCGADRCEAMEALRPAAAVINLGELRRPMNGALFVGSAAWPLAGKMTSSNFPETALAHVDATPATEISWFRAGRHPAQGIIAVSGTTEGALAVGGRNTTGALGVAEDSTGGAIAVGADSTGHALGKSYHKTLGALGTSARRVGEGLHVTPPEKQSQ